jgi:hypothetical protein
MDHEARRDFHPKFEEALSFVCRLHAEQRSLPCRMTL